jgi:hypothetical protein
MTRARIAVRSAEEPTDALLAGKVQRKVSNGIAGLAAAGSSSETKAIAANSCLLDDAE